MAAQAEQQPVGVAAKMGERAEGSRPQRKESTQQQRARQRQRAAAELLKAAPVVADQDRMRVEAQAAARRISMISKVMTQAPVAPRRKRKLEASSRKKAVKFAHWNMARLTKSQIQMLDELE